MVVLRSFFVCLMLISLIACQQRVKTVEDLQAYISKEKNGLVKTKAIGNIEIKVVYKPTGLLVNQELGNKAYTDHEVEQLRTKYGDFHYFTLSVSANGKEVEAYNVSGQGDFGSRVQQLSFGMGEQVALHTNRQDTIPVADYIYQRTFGVGNSSDMLFAFEKDKIENSEWTQFQLEDFGLGIGTNRFRFKTKDLKNVPSLNFKAKK
jgi:hypothetical protein